jgi:hypothetical protein
MKRLLGALSLALALCAAALAGNDEPKPVRKKPAQEDVEKAGKAVRAYLDRIKGGHAQCQPLADASVERLLPAYAFFSVRFRQFPVAQRYPAPLKASNVFAVGRDGAVHPLTTAKNLEKFFKDRLPALLSKARAVDAAHAWMRLSQELIQDGFYRFRLEKDGTRVGGRRGGGRAATARVVVMAGGNGTLLATLNFDRAGKLDSVKEEIKIRRGPRPICQATKLLDQDPVVRAMAEQALLDMGRAAQPYLDEQRARASPALRKAIDRIWQRIVETDP